MDVLLIVDMQEALLHGEPKRNLTFVVEGINRLAAHVRSQGGCVIFVQHDGTPGDPFAPFTGGWQILSPLRVEPGDRTVRKTLNDAFFGTSLQSDLTQLGPQRILVSGWATDLCVDATVRSAAALGHKVVVVSDCHTVSDRSHLSAERIIEHHHWVWTNLIAKHSVTLSCAADL